MRQKKRGKGAAKEETGEHGKEAEGLTFGQDLQLDFKLRAVVPRRSGAGVAFGNKHG